MIYQPTIKEIMPYNLSQISKQIQVTKTKCLSCQVGSKLSEWPYFSINLSKLVRRNTFEKHPLISAAIKKEEKNQCHRRLRGALSMNSVIDLGWHQTEEGQGALAHLRDPITGAPKRIFGILEVRFLPNKLLIIKY